MRTASAMASRDVQNRRTALSQSKPLRPAPRDMSQWPKLGRSESRASVDYWAVAAASCHAARDQLRPFGGPESYVSRRQDPPLTARSDFAGNYRRRSLIGFNTGGAADPLGIVLVLGAALGCAGGNILAKRAGNIDMLALMVWSGLAAVPPLLAAALVIEGPELMMRRLTQADAFAWATVPWQSFANSLFGYSVWIWLLARHPAADVAPIGLLVAVLSISAAAWLLAEPMPAWKVAATALVLTGLAVNVWRSRSGGHPANEIDPTEVKS
ncbi:DMT family transporter [Sphingomonas sp. ID0503]|uniref:DMT family transporter n=1 Tax=Sphingomonas sp. ID0503 TaxID=3399691 RepID=UPI003AFB5B9E